MDIFNVKLIYGNKRIFKDKIPIFYSNNDFDDISLGYTKNEGESQDSLSLKVNLDDLTLSLEQSHTVVNGNKEVTRYTDYSITGAGIISIILRSKTNLPIPMDAPLPAGA